MVIESINQKNFVVKSNSHNLLLVTWEKHKNEWSENHSGLKLLIIKERATYFPGAVNLREHGIFCTSTTCIDKQEKTVNKISKGVFQKKKDFKG